MWFHSHGTSRQIGGTDAQQKHTCEYTFANRGEGYTGKPRGARKAYVSLLYAEHQGQYPRKLYLTLSLKDKKYVLNQERNEWAAEDLRAFYEREHGEWSPCLLKEGRKWHQCVWGSRATWKMGCWSEVDMPACKIPSRSLKDFTLFLRAIESH